MRIIKLGVLFATMLIVLSSFSLAYSTGKIEFEHGITNPGYVGYNSCDVPSATDCINNGWLGYDVTIGSLDDTDCRCYNRDDGDLVTKFAVNVDEVSEWGVMRLARGGGFTFPAIDNTLIPDFVSGNYYVKFSGGYSWDSYDEDLWIENLDTGQVVHLIDQGSDVTMFLTCTVPTPITVNVGDRLRFYQTNDAGSIHLDWFELTDVPPTGETCVESAGSCDLVAVDVSDVLCGPDCAETEDLQVTAHGWGDRFGECGDNLGLAISFNSTDGDCRIDVNNTYGDQDIYGGGYTGLTPTAISGGNWDYTDVWNIPAVPADCVGDWMYPVAADLYTSSPAFITSATQLIGGFRFAGPPTNGPPQSINIYTHGETDFDSLVRVGCYAEDNDPADVGNIIYDLDYSPDGFTWFDLDTDPIFNEDGLFDIFAYSWAEGTYQIRCEATDTVGQSVTEYGLITIDHTCSYDYCEYFNTNAYELSNDPLLSWDTSIPALTFDSATGFPQTDLQTTSTNYKLSLLTETRAAAIYTTEINDDNIDINLYLSKGAFFYPVVEGNFLDLTAQFDVISNALSWRTEMSANSQTPFITRIGLEYSKCDVSNIVLDDSSCTGLAGTCKEGDTVQITGDITGDCPANLVLQVDANDNVYDGNPGSGCDIQSSVYSTFGDMEGMSISCTSGGCNAAWTIPEVPHDCRGQDVTGRLALLHETSILAEMQLSTSTDISGTVTFEDYYCGNGITEPGEECDGVDPISGDWGNYITQCSDLNSGFSDISATEKLGCWPPGSPKECLFNTTGCDDGVSGGELCGNGVIETDEDCDGTNWGHVTGCEYFDDFTYGTLTCGTIGARGCQFDTSECRKGGHEIEFICGKPTQYWDGGAYVTITQVSDEELTCDDNFASAVTRYCEYENDCVYGNEANEANPGENLECYNVGEIIQNQFGNDIVCEADNHWCPNGFLWDASANAGAGACIESFTVCDIGFDDSTINNCDDPPGDLYANPSECLSDFSGAAEPAPWNGACCEWADIGGFLILTQEGIIVY